MKFLLTAFLAFAQLLVAAPASAQTKLSADAPAVAFTNVTVVPMDRERVIPGQTVVIRNGRIETIAPTAAMTLPADLPQIDGTGRYLMPGLAEMHAHVPPNPEQAQWTKDVLYLYVANGITFARSMLGASHHLGLRAKAEAGEIVSPRLLLSGPSFNGNSVASPEAARKMVAEQKAAGYDFLKIHPGLDRARYDAVAEAANAAQIPFGGHVPEAVGIERALEAGQRTLDHLDGVMALLLPAGAGAGDTGFFDYGLVDQADERLIPQAVGRLRDAGVWLIPTETLMHNVLLPGMDERLAARDELRYVPQEMRGNWRQARAEAQSQPDIGPDRTGRFIALRNRMIKAMNDGGAGLLLGSDAPQIYNVPGFSLHHELAALVEAGLSPFEALATGTRNVARFLGEEERYGIVAEGARADLILLDANPLQDVANIQRRAGVMLGGRWLPEERLKEGLAEIAARHRD